MNDFILVALTFDNGSVGIMRFYLAPRLGPEAEVPGFNRVTGRRSDADQYIQHDIDKTNWGKLKVVSWRKLGQADAVAAMTVDRAFRNALRDRNGRIELDLPAARELHRDRMRRARAPLLEKLDVEYMRADEAGDSVAKANVKLRKNILRNVTEDPRIESAQTTDELRTAWPKELDGE